MVCKKRTEQILSLHRCCGVAWTKRRNDLTSWLEATGEIGKIDTDHDPLRRTAHMETADPRFLRPQCSHHQVHLCQLYRNYQQDKT